MTRKMPTTPHPPLCPCPAPAPPHWPAAAAAGKGCDLAEFVFQQLQKRVGIVTAVVEVRRLQGGVGGVDAAGKLDP